jgi:ankyrin repeat protein
MRMKLLFAAASIALAMARADAQTDPAARLKAILHSDDVSALQQDLGANRARAQTSEGMIPLIVAAQNNAHKSVRWLLANGADVHATTSSGSTALSMAAYGGHLETLEVLIAAGAKLGHKSRNGYQPLDWALEQNHQPALRKLMLAWGLQEARHDDERRLLTAIAGGQSVPARYQPGFTSFALVLSIVHDDVAMTEHLLKHGWDANLPNAAGYAALPTAARLGNARMVELLLAHKADPNLGGTKGNDVAGSLNQAARGLRLDAARLLVGAGANVNRPNAIGITPLYICAIADTSDGRLSELLLQHQAQVRQKAADDYDSLDVAMEQRNRLFMRHAMRHLLVQSLADAEKARVQAQGLVALASQPGLTAESRALLLNVAVVNGDTALFEQLLHTGVAPNTINRSGHFPLSLAASWGEAAMVTALIGRGASIDAQNDNRYRTSALMESTRGGHVEIARVLLAHGANVNLPDAHRDHALNWAVFFGRQPMVSMLLDYKADTTQIGQQSNDNAMDIALRQGVPDVIAVLRAAGAKPSKGGASAR